MEELIAHISSVARGMWRFRWTGLIVAWVVGALGAVVAFYFGARETWYFRNRGTVSPYAAGGAAAEDNAALQDWRTAG